MRYTVRVCLVADFAVLGAIVFVRALLVFMLALFPIQISSAQRDLDANFRSWRSGATHLRAGDAVTALAAFQSVWESGLHEPFVSCTIGLIAATLSDTRTALSFLQLVRSLRAYCLVFGVGVKSGC
jgi:hypothetical protein